jgi:chromosome partitioning protein
MRVVAIANQKGGCGKTTTAINLSACLSFLQKKVLLIDFDPQGHATCGFGIKPEFLEATTYNLFQNDHARIDDLKIPINDALSIVPTYVALSQVEQELSGLGEEAHLKLSNLLDRLSESVDFVIIDSPPNLGFLTYNALCAASEVIIPIEPSFFSLHGLAKIFETIDRLDRKRLSSIKVHALLTRFEKRSRLGREIYDEVREHFKDRTFHHVIHENVKLREAAASGKSIVDYDRESAGFKDYIGLAIEVIERGLLADNLKGQVQDTASIGLEQKTDRKKGVTGEEDESRIDELSNQNGYAQAPSTAEVMIREIEASGSLEDQERLTPREVLGGTLFTFVSKDVHSVMLAGDFNRWIAEPMMLMNKKEGLWQKVVPMKGGLYHYKFLVDDNWRTDPFNEETKMNPYGGFDSVIRVEGHEQPYEDRKEAETRTA